MQTPDRDAVERILGVSANAGPFTMLDLEVRDLDDAEIIDALGRRMKQVAQHPLSESAEGNEVRLALHAAAARLLDPAVRRAMLLRAGAVSSPPTASRPAARANTVSSVTPSVPLGSQALQVVAAEGGWNTNALRRVAMLAHARGIPSEEVPAAILAVLGSAARPVADTSQERRGQTPRSPSVLHPERSLGSSIVLVVFVILALVALALTWRTLARSAATMREATITANSETPTEQAQVDLADETLLADARPHDSTERPAADAAGATAGTPSDAPNWLAAAAGIREDSQPPDASVTLRVLEGMARTWLDRTDAERALAQTVVTDLLYRFAPGDGTKLIAGLGEVAAGDDLVSAAWATGMLARLSQEPSLARGVDSAIVAALAGAVGDRVRSLQSSFGHGVQARLESAADGWSVGREMPAGSAEAWMRVAERLQMIESALAQAALRRSLSTMLLGEADLAANREQRLLVDRAGRLLTLPDDPRNTAFVLSVVADAKIEPARLTMLLASLRRNPALADLASSLDLPPTASAARRAELRAVLEQAWLGEGGGGWATEDFVNLARAQLTRPQPSAEAEQLVEAVAAARLNAAASLLLWGDRELARTITANLRADLEQVLARQAPRVTGRVHVAGARDWAERYLEARRNIPVRQSLLTELVRVRPQLGPVAAEVLVTEAMLGTPVQVRRQATEALVVFAGDPAFVNAVLELLPRAPRHRSIAPIVELAAGTTLPSIDDPAWALEARRAVVARLLGMLAGAGSTGKLDELGELLAEAYAQRLRENFGGTGAALDDLPRLAGRLRQIWLEEARRADRTGEAEAEIRAITRTLEGRLAMAEGDVQRFAAEQVSAFDAAALAARFEMPARTPEIRSIARGLAAARREAAGAFEQIGLTEHAMLRLWLLRAGETP
ncbi:MAG: hypothetical protein ACTS22_04660 [Phycisphaerales bacterium]